MKFVIDFLDLCLKNGRRRREKLGEGFWFRRTGERKENLAEKLQKQGRGEEKKNGQKSLEISGKRKGKTHRFVLSFVFFCVMTTLAFTVCYLQ